MIIDTHVAGYPRNPKNPKLGEIVSKDWSWQIIQKIYGSPDSSEATSEPVTEDYVEAMDRLGMEKLVIHSLGYLPETCRALNDETSALCEKHPEQLVGFATVPVAFPEESVPELERAVRELGLRGLKIYPKFQQVTLDSECMRPIYRKAEELGIPILTHSDSITSSYTGFGFKEVDNTSCNPARLFRSGILKDTPKLKIILAHLGGGVMFDKDHLYAIARYRAQVRGEPSLESYFDHLFSEQLYYDLAPVNWYSQETLEMAISVVGADRFLFATDYPMLRGLPGVEECIRHLDSLALPESTKDKIRYENARKLLRP
jgi:predicted TIM-barrel fold metal-dependent hydrolase